MAKSKQKDSPVRTPIQTPLNTPDRPLADNSFLPLQSDSEKEEEQSVATITANKPPADIDDSVDQAPAATPGIKTSSSRPIAEILPTDLERLKESIPIFASDLANTAGKLFDEPKPNESTPPKSPSIKMTTELKPPPVASLSPSAAFRVNRPDRYANSLYFNSAKHFSKQTPPLSPNQDRSLAEELFGSDSKPPAARSAPGYTNRASTTLSVEATSPEAATVVEKLNQAIAEKQALLAKLQSSIQALKSDSAASSLEVIDETMEDVDPDPNQFIVVQRKPPPADQASTNVPKGPQPNSQLTVYQQPSSAHDPLTELAQRRPVYLKLPDPSPRRPFFQRTTWKIEISEKMESPQQGSVDATNEIWIILKEADEKLIIYPWRQFNHGKYKALTGPSKLPSTKEAINRYFPDAYFRPHPGNMYLRAYIGTSIPEEELGLRTQYFFGANANRSRVGFWKNVLQFEDTVEIGWLFRSTPGMSATTIQAELLAHTGIHAALRWKIINVVEFKGKLEKKFQVKALHISVRREDGNLAKAKFTKLVFAKHRRSHFIGGSPMRMIPISKDLSPRNKDKGMYNCSRQQTFLKDNMMAEAFDILQIDNCAVGLKGRSLHELILEIPLRDFPNKQAFLSADRTFKGSTVKVCFYKIHELECRNRISTLLPYLMFTNPFSEKGIRACFSADANERAKGVKWDSKRKEVITVDDEIFDSIEEDLDSDDETAQSNAEQFIFNLAEATGLALTKSQKMKTNKIKEGDAASLFSQSTFRSKENNKVTNVFILSPISSTDVAGRPRLGTPYTSQDSNL
jgi:hypothetical protein